MKILLIEDEISLRLGMARALERAGHRIDAAGAGAEGIGLFRKAGYDIVITDLMLPDMNGMDVLRAVKDVAPDAGIIVITAYANVRTAVEAMRAGAYDYLSKPFDPEEMLIVIERFVGHKRLELDNRLLREQLHGGGRFQNIVGASPVMRDTYAAIDRVAKTDSSVIIYGETGTGKELVANAIHELSPRRAKPFVKINCAAIPETLLESELFGHEKGAFTGALQRKKGKFELADGGTILFDEIGDMPLSLQAKLLRVLESFTFERLGGNEPVSVDVRPLFATRRDLQDEIRDGRFREDLYYRINVVPVTLPPLRERKEDIPDLAQEFLERFSERNGCGCPEITARAAELLATYNFPGNVRELKHAVEMAAILCSGGPVMPDHLPVAIRNAAPLLCRDEAGSAAASLAEHVQNAERDMITRVLEETGGKKSLTARRLGISRKTLWRKLKEHHFPQYVLEGGD